MMAARIPGSGLDFGDMFTRFTNNYQFPTSNELYEYMKYMFSHTIQIKKI